ncbi:MAG: hypothetical protein MJK18_11020, partial [Bdellovibrionales bacterium]|nr:hypothetical protein [Bdellovibrionales bacterium]
LIGWAVNGNFELACGGSTTVSTVNGGVVNNGTNVQSTYNVSITLFPGGVWTGEIETAVVHGGSNYRFELRPVSGSSWVDNSKNPPLGMFVHTDGFYYFVTNLGGNSDETVGRLIQ